MASIDDLRTVVREELATIAREGKSQGWHAGPLFPLTQDVKAIGVIVEEIKKALPAAAAGNGGTVTQIDPAAVAAAVVAEIKKQLTK